MSNRGVFFSVALGKSTSPEWTGQGLMSVTPRQDSLSSDKTAEKEEVTAERGKSTLQRNTRHSVFVRKRDKAAIYVSR